MPWDDTSLDWLQRNYQYVRDYLGRPFAVENVSLSFRVPRGQYREPEFLREFLLRTDATLLLDVTNMFNNCINYQEDPIEYLHALPPDRISQIHLAGGHYDDDGFLVDSHSFAVMDEVWDLYRETLRHTTANIVILERDYQCFPFRDVMRDIRKARELFYEIRPESAPDAPSDASAAPVGANGLPDHMALEFSNHRAYQRAILKSITDDEFRRRVEVDPDMAARQLAMGEEWVTRLPSRRKLDQMAESWKETERLDREDEERFRRWEWSQWAAQR